MTRHTLDNHIEITPGVLGGKPRIAGRRIAVESIVIQHEKLGRTADEIANEFSLGLADVHAALAFYFDHRAEIDDSIGRGQAFAARLRSKIRSRLGGEAGGRADSVPH